jgi:hypothetical protein
LAAFIYGIINGIVDLIAGFFIFIGMLFNAAGTLLQTSGNVIDDLGYYKDLLFAYINEFGKALSNIDWNTVVTTLTKTISSLITVDAIVKAIDGINITVYDVAYYTGYIGINIVVCFIPVVDLLQIGKAAKFTQPIAQLFEKILSIGGKAGKAFAKTFDDLAALMSNVLELLKKGTEEVTNFIKRIISAIKKWLDELLGVRSIRKELIEKVPPIKEFRKWYNDLTIDEFEIVWANKKLKESLIARIRNPGGYHEWLLVSRTDKFKSWGVKMEIIKKFRSKTSKVNFVNPPGRHGGKGSTKAHNELLKLIDSSNSFEEYIKKLNTWADKRLEGGRNSLPKL